jgi:hypothetical protein
MKPSKGFDEKSRYWFTRKVEIITVPTFTKLLIIRIVARSNLEFPSRCTIRLLAADFDDLISFNCEGEREKKAVSEADAAAEHTNKTITAIIPDTRPAEEARSAGVKFNKIKAFSVTGSW